MARVPSFDYVLSDGSREVAGTVLSIDSLATGSLDCSADFQSLSAKAVGNFG